jgi:DNA repair exonuclease SbcCD nuclease subunit
MIAAFVDAIDQIIALKPDLCLHAGDLFHSVRPLNSIMAVAAEQLHRLAEQHGIPTVIIAGNHDAPKQPHVGAALSIFRHIENLYIAADGRAESFQIGRVKCHALPHCLTTDSLQTQLAALAPDPNAEYNILVAHGVAAGMPEFSMADLGEQELSMELLDRFDYAALGHFHNFTRVSRRAYYAGSTERLSQAEREAAKGFACIETDPFEIRFQEVRCRAMVDIPVINAAGKRGDELAAIIADRVAQVGGSDKIVRIKVQGVSEETLKTIPSAQISALKEKSFALDIRLEKEKDDRDASQFGRAAIGRVDIGFIEFLEAVDLQGFDREWLKREALKYLASND